MQTGTLQKCINALLLDNLFPRVAFHVTRISRKGVHYLICTLLLNHIQVRQAITISSYNSTLPGIDHWLYLIIGMVMLYFSVYP